MDVMQAIRNRRSIRKYSFRAIPEETLERLKDAMRHAPSACNNQPWTFILVRDAEARTKLGEASRNQMFIAEAPVIVVAVGYPDVAYKKMGGHGSSVDLDIAIALDHLSLAAVAEGLGTCWIGAFEEESIKKVLNIPAQAKVVALMPVGFPGEPDIFTHPRESRRKDSAEVFREEKY